jgi:hypothetical protein
VMTCPLRSLGSELQSYTMNTLNIVRKMSNIISLIVGGTVDITAHEKLGEHKIAESLQSSLRVTNGIVIFTFDLLFICKLLLVDSNALHRSK